MGRVPWQVSGLVAEPQLSHPCVRGGGQRVTAGIGCQGDQSTGSPSQRGGKSWARRFRLNWVTVDHRPRTVWLWRLSSR